MGRESSQNLATRKMITQTWINPEHCHFYRNARSNQSYLEQSEQVFSNERVCATVRRGYFGGLFELCREAEKLHKQLAAWEAI